MHGDPPSTVSTFPFFRLILKKLCDTTLLNIPEILHRSRKVFDPVALVQASKLLARKFIALKAEFLFPAPGFFTRFHFAPEPGDGFAHIACSAAGARVFLPKMPATDGAVDAARGY